MRTLLLASAVALASVGVGNAQMLTCQPVSSANPTCETFHFHVQMFRPDTRGFSEVYGANQFASQAACEHARDAAIRRNAAIVDFFHRVRNDDRWQADKFGLCHCDMTIERSSPNYLTDVQRAAQIKLAEDVRQRVRERLLDANLTSDNDLVRSATFHDPPAPLLGGPKLVAIPAAPAVANGSNSPDDLRMTTAVDTSTQAVATLDLPLVEIPLPGVATTIDAPAPTPAVATVAPQPAPAPPPATTPAAAPEPKAVPEVTVAPPEPPAPPPVDDAAEVFVTVEMQRVRNVIAAGSNIADEAEKSKVIEACMQRTQVLSTLRSLIEGSGAKSRFAAAAREAREEPARLALVSKLFGTDMPPHWAPKDAADVVVETSGDPASAEQILHDASGKYDAQQKRHALYLLLARTQPTEEQQLWLTSVIDSLLQ